MLEINRWLNIIQDYVIAKERLRYCLYNEKYNLKFLTLVILNNLQKDSKQRVFYLKNVWDKMFTCITFVHCKIALTKPLNIKFMLQWFYKIQKYLLLWNWNNEKRKTCWKNKENFINI